MLALRRADVSFTIGNVVVTDPTTEQLLGMREGDKVDVSPAPGKCDEWLEIHAHFPYLFIFKQEHYNVAAALRDIELRFPSHGAARQNARLFGDDKGQAYPRSVFCSWLRDALTHLYGQKVASLYTWHSYRSGFATALHAAGVPDEVILLLCHWISPESLRSYRRLSHAEQDSAISAASKVAITLLQPRNAPVVCGDQHYATLLSELTPPRTERHRTTLSRFESSDDSLSDAQRRRRQRASNAPPPQPQITTAVEQTPPAAEKPELGQPISSPPSQGTTVIIPQRVWPKYNCSEHNGLGWEAVVRSSNSTSAVVRFTNAKTPSGRPYEDARLPLGYLHSPPRTNVPYLRGGCSPSQQQPAAASVEVGTDSTTAPLNRCGYPQIVPDNFCALCKRELPPLRGELVQERSRPTAMASLERLQCERCKRVRYCSAWCAHIHYEACHKHLCPLPPFSRDFNAKYVVRSGQRVRSFPIRCVASRNSTLNPRYHQAGHVFVWTVAQHGDRLRPQDSCQWCLRSPADAEAPHIHNLWFVALVTRIVHSEPHSVENISWEVMPRWRGPLAVFPDVPSSPADPRVAWPEPDALARYRSGTVTTPFATFD